MKKLLIALLLPVAGYSQMSEAKSALSVAESKVFWEGNNVAGGGHTGTLQATSGFIEARGQNITQGEIMIDMNTIQTNDKGKIMQKSGLIDHLKDKDFFDVAQFPTAKFMIVKVTPDPLKPGQNMYNIQGLLQIRGRTNLVTFPVSIITTGKTINVTGDIVFDRTKWDITYHSKGFFADLKNSAIADEVKVRLELVFKGK